MTNKIVAFGIALAVMMLSKVVSGDALIQASNAITAGPRGMRSFMADPSGETSAKVIVGLVVALTVGLIVIGYLFPVGMQAYHAINFTAAGMTADEQSIYNVLGIFAIICLLLTFIGIAMKAHDS